MFHIDLDLFFKRAFFHIRKKKLQIFAWFYLCLIFNGKFYYHIHIVWEMVVLSIFILNFQLKLIAKCIFCLNIALFWWDFYLSVSVIHCSTASTTWATRILNGRDLNQIDQIRLRDLNVIPILSRLLQIWRITRSSPSITWVEKKAFCGQFANTLRYI